MELHVRFYDIDWEINHYDVDAQEVAEKFVRLWLPPKITGWVTVPNDAEVQLKGSVPTGSNAFHQWVRENAADRLGGEQGWRINGLSIEFLDQATTSIEPKTADPEIIWE